MQVQPAGRRDQQPPSRRFINLSSKAFKQQKFDFKTQQLAFSVRQVVYQKIIAFDANGDQHFQQGQIRQFLVHVLHEVETEIHYFIKNVFRYDYNNDGVIEYDELVNFCMEQHLGEIAIQRLHRQKVYSRGASRQMNGQEFTKTITYALSFIEFKPNPTHLESLFKSVDLDGDGFISYEDYFRFLKEYFGSKSLAAGLVSAASVREEMQHPEKKELDIVRKYSKYEKGGEGGTGGQGQGHGAGKHVPSNAIKNSIMNGGNTNSNAGNQGGSNINNPNINNPNINNNPNANSPNPIYPNNGNNLPNTPNGNPFGNPNQNTNTNTANPSQGGMRSSGVSNIDAKTIDNSSISRDLELNSQSTDKKRNSSNSQGGIQVTIGKPSIKTPRETREAEIALLSEQEGIVGARIARLVMTQLKTNLINYDTAKSLRLSSEEILKFLRTVLNFNEANILAIMKKGTFPKDKKWNYQEASKVVISESTAKIFSQLAIPDLTKPVTVEEFVKIWDRVCSIVVNTPLIDKFEQLYKLRVAKTGQLDYNELYQLINLVFAAYGSRQ